MPSQSRESRHIKLRKGLDLPIGGAPQQQIADSTLSIHHVAVAGVDFVDLKPDMRVAEGDQVKLGQVLFAHKTLPEIVFTAPGAGQIEAIHRGAQRRLLSVVIRLDEQETEETFAQYAPEVLHTLTADEVKTNLLASGLWTALRTRPFSKLPDPSTRPAAIFITAMDSNPLAADPAPLIAAEAADFGHGLQVLARLTDGPLWLCHDVRSSLALAKSALSISSLRLAAFSGPHPAGLPGTHIHFLQPADLKTTVWHLNYQDVIAIGKLFTTGRLAVERIVAFGGPPVARPRLLRTRMGASIEELLASEGIDGNENRIISGSVWSGHRAVGELAYLGRYHLQISAIREAPPREFLGWLRPDGNKFSRMNVFFSSLLHKRKAYEFSASQHGSPRAMIPISTFEEVMPLDILPAQLLRALLVADTDMAQKLGCLELDEEDLALCSFVCVGKHDYGVVLRNNLRLIEKEG
ncbi:MAG: Na+-translocating NADH:ubiquinone oxidoreductase subunit Nrq1 [Pseudomonadota bacterium]